MRPLGFAIRTLIWVVCLPHKFSMFISVKKCRSHGVIISWLTSKGIFPSFDVLKGVDSEKFSDFLEGELPRFIPFFGWGLLSGEDTDEGRRPLILACESLFCGVELNGTSTFFSKPERMKWKSSAAQNIFLPQDWQTLLDTRLESTMFRPISEQISANVLPSRFTQPEGLNKFSVEIYLVLFWKLPNFILKLTPHNLQKSSTLSSLAFPPLTGFVGVFPLNFRYSPWEVAMRAVNHQHSETFRAKIIGSFELQVSLSLADLIGISWGNKSGRHSAFRSWLLRRQISLDWYSGSATKSHSPSTQYRQLRRLPWQRAVICGRHLLNFHHLQQKVTTAVYFVEKQWIN